MQSQQTQSARSKPKFSAGRIVLLILFALIAIAAIATGILAITPSPANVSGFIVGVGGFIATLYQTFVAAQSTATPSTSNTVFTSLNDPLDGNVAQSTSIQTAQLGSGSLENDHSLQGIPAEKACELPFSPFSYRDHHSEESHHSQLIFFPQLELRNSQEFYGHNAARTSLINRTLHGSCSSIVGGPKAGKTWLLDYLQLVVPSESPNYRVVRINAKHSECKTQIGFVQLALKELKVPFLDPSSQPLGQLSQAVRNLKQLGLCPVLCVDRFERLTVNKQEFDGSFFEGLRTIVQDDGLILITASVLPLEQLIGDLVDQTSPLFNIMPQISLSPFTEQEARQFVHDKSNRAGFTEKEREFFFKQSMHNDKNRDPSWLPLRLQRAGQLLFDDKQGVHRQPLDDRLDNFDYKRDFEKRMNESY